MSALLETFPGCPPPAVPVSIVGPPGAPGAPGDKGDTGPAGPAGASVTGPAGKDAFTTVQIAFVVPGVGSLVAVTVGDTSWMSVGMTVIAAQGPTVIANPGPATFVVSSIGSATLVTLKFLGYFGDVPAGNTISAGALLAVGASGTVQRPVVSTQAGINQAITATSAQVGVVKFTVPAVGNWLLQARVSVTMTGATFASSRTVTIKIRNVTQGVDLATATRATGVLTTTTLPTIDWALAPVLDATAAVNDIIEVYISIDVINSAGTFTVDHCYLAAIPCR